MPQQMEGDNPLGPAPAPATPAPVGDTAPDPGVRRLDYRELVDEVATWSGLDFDRATSVAGATVTVLARTLGEDDRRRLLDALPPELYEDADVTTPFDGDGAEEFVQEITRLAHRPPEQGHLQAQAVLGAIAAQDEGLLASLHTPSWLDELTGIR